MRWPLLAWISLTAATGCFSDPTPTEGSSSSSGEACTPGSEGCTCLELQCEAGLQCQGAVCVPAPGETSPAGTTSETTGVSTATASTAGTASTATAGESSSSTSASGSESSSGTSTTVDDTGGSTGPADTCGDRVIDANEECDGILGCTENCELENYGCNPLNNVPCGNLKCSVFEDEAGVITSGCQPFLEAPPLALHEGNCVSQSMVQDAACDVGLACVFAEKSPLCDTNCCVEFCNLEGAGECAGTPEVQCRQFLFPPAPEGLEFLGFCAI